MTPLPAAPDLLPDLLDVARRVVWFKPPVEALKDQVQFLAHLMTYSTPEDVLTVRKYLSLADFRHALENAPPGIFDPRSWTYWNLVCGRDPVPEMPRRTFAETSAAQHPPPT